jgi:hypothetical protein
MIGSSVHWGATPWNKINKNTGRHDGTAYFIRVRLHPYVLMPPCHGHGHGHGFSVHLLVISLSLFNIESESDLMVKHFI